VTQNDRATVWDSLAAQCDRAAALVMAGISPNHAWGVTFAVAPAGNSVAMAERNLIEAAWVSSVDIGAPLNVTLNMLSQTYRALAAIDRDVSAAIAGPRMATRVMLTLPAVGVLVAGALGLNVLTFFFNHWLGALCLIGGAALLCVGWWWSRALIERVSTDSVPRGVVATVIVAGLRVGVGVQSSADALARSLGAEPVAHDTVHLRHAQELSAVWGAPLADIVLAETHQTRDAWIARAREQCAELSEKIVLPLGACVLPAFILLAVVPIVVELISSSGIASVG